MEHYQVKSKDCLLQVYSVNPKSLPTIILFLHGGPGSGAKAIMELPAFERLSQDYHCLYFDQRGSGGSNYNLGLGLSIDMITDDVKAVVEDAKRRYYAKQIYLWGGSFGGCLASLCLERFPDLFSGAILSSPAITFNRNQALEFYLRMQEPYSKRINLDTFDSSLNQLAPEQFFAIEPIKRFVFSDMNPSQSLRHICAMSPWFYQHYFDKLFNNLSIPILIMQGKDDEICIYENLDNALNNHSSNIEYYLYDNCGHEVFKDKEDEFVDNIKLFIRRIEGC